MRAVVSSCFTNSNTGCITDGVRSEISGYAYERRTLFTIQETVILPVVLCGFETWSVLSPRGTVTILYIADIEPFETKW